MHTGLPFGEGTLCLAVVNAAMASRAPRNTGVLKDRSPIPAVSDQTRTQWGRPGSGDSDPALAYMAALSGCAASAEHACKHRCRHWRSASASGPVILRISKASKAWSALSVNQARYVTLPLKTKKTPKASCWVGPGSISSTSQGCHLQLGLCMADQHRQSPRQHVCIAVEGALRALQTIGYFTGRTESSAALLPPKGTQGCQRAHNALHPAMVRVLLQSAPIKPLMLLSDEPKHHQTKMLDQTRLWSLGWQHLFSCTCACHLACVHATAHCVRQIAVLQKAQAVP